MSILPSNTKNSEEEIIPMVADEEITTDAGQGGELVDHGLLQFITAGSVDDGKSTLIGRLLLDSKALFLNQIKRLENGEDLAHITDGLRAEREQGITIDVARRFFATDKRRFIIADCPGHVQYTKNMITGASTADLAVLLIDARFGITEQTRRHSFICSLLRVPSIVFCINKMDLVDYSSDRFLEVTVALNELASHLNFANTHMIPISALEGDNVVDKGENMPWYGGDTLLHIIENEAIVYENDTSCPRFPVQTTIKPNNDGDHKSRRYAGTISGGAFCKGMEVIALPSKQCTTINSIHTFENEITSANAGTAVSISLSDAIDCGRGSTISPQNKQPLLATKAQGMVFWMTEDSMKKGKIFDFIHAGAQGKCIVSSVDEVINLSNLNIDIEVDKLQLNDLGKASFEFTNPIALDTFENNKTTGRLILIDPATNDTVASLIITNIE